MGNLFPKFDGLVKRYFPQILTLIKRLLGPLLFLFGDAETDIDETVNMIADYLIQIIGAIGTIILNADLIKKYGGKLINFFRNIFRKNK